MNRDPHAGRFGARVHDAVSDMGGDQKPVARSQRALVAIVPEQARFSLQQRHPFVAVLVVPLALGRGLPDGDDALDATAPTGRQFVEEFAAVGRAAPRQVEKTAALHFHDSPPRAMPTTRSHFASIGFHASARQSR